MTWTVESIEYDEDKADLKIGTALVVWDADGPNEFRFSGRGDFSDGAGIRAFRGQANAARNRGLARRGDAAQVQAVMNQQAARGG